MTYNKLIKSMEFYGSTKSDICSQFIGVDNSVIQTKVVIAPWWEPTIFNDFEETIVFESKSESSEIKVWNNHSSLGHFTYIKTGIGAPVLTDIVLALGVTNCKEILFIGSVGALDSEINIGDIVIPEFSISGDGFSRYLKSGKLYENDPFGEKSFPDLNSTEKLLNISKTICNDHNIRVHRGKNFSTDTIFAQFAFIEEILKLGCNVIEMETASAFRAAELTGVCITALFSVSDNTIQRKSLVSGIDESENEYRRYVRKMIFPKIIKGFLFIE